ncbi:unnamed protein product [Miscanthus lutarioriparius]|uniref:Plastocyanin-like domain-containing protein n=1 Tax=Miscanthus lutarioriparius TaxID=422564 RepID=A0A811NH54_9POAL|nr:unnamed protein product [Miscanthus lutarioriparius]
MTSSCIANHTLVVDVDALYVKPFTVDTLVIASGQTSNVLFISTKPMYPGARYYTEARRPDNLPVFAPTLPQIKTTKHRSLGRAEYLATAPRNIDWRFFFTAGLGTHTCAFNGTCQGPNGSQFAASINNVLFVLPTVALLQVHFVFVTNNHDFEGSASEASGRIELEVEAMS